MGLSGLRDSFGLPLPRCAADQREGRARGRGGRQEGGREDATVSAREEGGREAQEPGIVGAESMSGRRGGGAGTRVVVGL